MTEIQCADLGIAECHGVFRGETPADAIEELRKHLRAEHDIDLPEADIILKSDPNWRFKDAVDDLMRDDYDEEEIIIVERLRTMFKVTTTEQARRQRADR
ncbi:MAG: DUF1059 domain-containing protein [Anaerolineae bacterium]